MKSLLACSDTVDMLDRQQKGRLAETIAKAIFLANNFEVFEPEFDDRGIDLLIRPPRSFDIYEIQVKSITKNNYTFLRKKFISADAKEHRFVCYIRLDCDPEPEVFLIPLKAWDEGTDILRVKEYDKPGQSSDPEYGICYAKKRADDFEKYKIQIALKKYFPILNPTD